MTTPNLGAMKSWIDSQQPAMIDLIGRLVSTDSGTYYKAGCDTCAKLLAEQAQRLGFATEFSHQTEYGDHVVARKPGTSKRLVMIGHFDTVWESDTTKTRPFRIEGDRAFGPGVVDMKAGLVSMLYALAALKERDRANFDALDVVLVFNSDEEVLSPTSRPIIEAECRQAATVCVLEPARPGGEYVHARKGAGKFWLEVLGKNAHAGLQPEAGASAIHALGHKIVDLAALNDWKGTGTSVNVGVVKGGSRSNVVCDYVEAQIDLRAWTLPEAEKTIARMKVITATDHVPGTRGMLRGGLDFPPMEHTPEIAALFERVKRVGATLGLDLKSIPTGGGSDGNHAAQFAPVMDGMGPRGGGAHSPDEFLLLPTVPERCAVLAGFIADWLRDNR